MARQQLALGSGRGLKAKVFSFLVAVAVVMWMAHQPTEAGTVTRDILDWLGHAADALVTLLHSLFQ
jgi:hypothetical protein